MQAAPEQQSKPAGGKQPPKERPTGRGLVKVNIFGDIGFVSCANFIRKSRSSLFGRSFTVDPGTLSGFYILSFWHVPCSKSSLVCSIWRFGGAYTDR